MGTNMCLHNPAPVAPQAQLMSGQLGTSRGGWGVDTEGNSMVIAFRSALWLEDKHVPCPYTVLASHIFLILNKIEL